MHLKHAQCTSNVPISEPLFEFNQAELAPQRKITSYFSVSPNQNGIEQVARLLLQAKRPIVVLGQGNHTLLNKRAHRFSQ